MTRLSYLPRPTQCNATTVREVVQGDKSSKIAVAMQALYKECVAQIIKDDNITFHVIMMPGMTGHHYTYALRDELELAQDCANLLDVDIHADDCLVILGHDILNNDISEDAMMRIVLSDIALHMRRLYPVTDQQCGWYAPSVSWAAIASVIAAAHPIIRTFPGMMYGQDADEMPVLTFSEEIASRASQAIRDDHRSKTPHLDIGQRRPIEDIISHVCDISVSTNGGYITLPTTVAAIHAVACEHYYEAINSMGYTPRALV